MHEYGLAQRIVESAVDAAGGRRLTAVRVRIGVRQAADPAALQNAFELAATGTPAAGSTLEVVVDPVVVTCRACGAITTSDDPFETCDRCGSTDVTRTGGTDLVLESVRLPGDAG